MFYLFRRLQAAILFSLCLASDIILDPKVEPNGTTPFELTQNSSDKISIRYEIPIVYPGRRAENTSPEFIHRRLNSDDVKRNLDEFILKRDRVFIPVYIPISSSVVERAGNKSNIDSDRINVQPFHYLNESDITSTTSTNRRPHAWKIPRKARKLFLEKENEPPESDLDVENIKLNLRENLSSARLGLMDNEIHNLPNYNAELTNLNTALENYIPSNTPPIEDDNTADISIKDIFDGTRRLKPGLRNVTQSPNTAIDTHTKNTDTNIAHKERDTAKAIGEEKTKFLKILNREDHIINILRKQTELLEQVARVLKEKEAVRSKKGHDPDFDDLLLELENKKKKIDGGNMTQAAIESVKKKIEHAKIKRTSRMPSTMVTAVKAKKKQKLTTIQTIIDETEVRKAIKNNPYVQRIMKMAKRKRDQYYKDAKVYFNL